MGKLERLVLLLLVIALLLVAIMVSGGVAHARDTQSLISEKLSVQKDICPAVKSVISENGNTAATVTTAIQMGHSACTVVKCSIEGGASLEQVIFGAVAAGASPDVISRCSTEAGARPDEVAAVLGREELAGLGYTPPGGSPVAIGFPGGGRSGGIYISPSSF